MGEDNKPVEEETKKENFLTKKKEVKGKPLKVWIIIMIIVFMLFTFGIGISLGKELARKELNNNKEEEPTNEIKEVKDSNAITRLDNYVKAASFDDSVGNGMARDYMTGKSSVDQISKNKLAWISLLFVKQTPTPTVTNIPDKYKDDLLFNAGAVTEIPLSSYANEYKGLFNEEFIYNNNISDYSVICPGAYKVEQELDRIYISRECGGTGNPPYFYKIYKYEEDNSNYYVYEYVATENPETGELIKVKSGEVVNVTTFEGNEDKFETVVWKFDKNFNFINTENKG